MKNKGRKNSMKKICKLDLWFSHYINSDSPETFLNKSGSAKAAGYKTSREQSFGEIGYQNSIKLQDRISKWIDEIGLSENALKKKLLNLIEAKETRFFQKDGKVIETREVEALETQRRTLDMAMKVKGLYEQDNLQRSDITVRIEEMRKRGEELAEEARKGMEKEKR